MLQAHRMCAHDKRPGQEACAAETLDRAGNDQRVRRGTQRGEKTASLENCQRPQKRRLALEGHVDAAVQRLESRRRQQVCAAVPSDVRVRVEVRCDVWNGLWSCWGAVSSLISFKRSGGSRNEDMFESSRQLTVVIMPRSREMTKTERQIPNTIKARGSGPGYSAPSPFRLPSPRLMLATSSASSTTT